MNPFSLIGMKYRLGSDPEKHGTADCLSLARTVLAYQGIATPEPKRSWYRRLKHGDTSVFPEELKRWGTQVSAPTMGAVVLCKAENGFGLAVYWEGGCLAFRGPEVGWVPVANLEAVAFYCQQKPT